MAISQCCVFAFMAARSMQAHRKGTLALDYLHHDCRHQLSELNENDTRTKLLRTKKRPSAARFWDPNNVPTFVSLAPNPAR